MTSQTTVSRWHKPALVLTMAVVGVAVMLSVRQSNWLEAAIEHEHQLKHYVEKTPALTALTVMVVYSLITALPIPIASLGSLVAGWLLGFWLGLPAISIGATLGASLTFLLTRFCFRDSVHALAGKHLASINRHLKKDGVCYVAILRLIPGLPFFLVNSLLAQTNLSLGAFVWASYVSMLPGTMLHLMAGASMPSLTRIRDEGIGSVMSWQLVGALLLLACQPLLFKAVLKAVRQPDKTHV